MMYSFKVRVAKVEEKFEKTYKAETMGEAKVESQVESDLKSIGWFVTIDGWGVSICFGDTKPELKAGDELIVSMR